MAGTDGAVCLGWGVLDFESDECKEQDRSLGRSLKPPEFSFFFYETKLITTTVHIWGKIK